MEAFRQQRASLITAFVGDGYGDAHDAKKVYLNLLSLAMSIFTRNLIAREPSVRIVTGKPELRPIAKNGELACQKAGRDVKLKDKLRSSVVDALVSPLSVLKVGLRYTGSTEAFGESVDVTEPFVEKVSFDDYVRDMSARSAYHPAFEGDAYELDMEEFRRRYPNAGEVTPDEESVQNEDGSDRAEALAHAPGAGGESKRSVILQDLWLTRERLLVTYLRNTPERGPLGIVKLDCPDESPYRTLWFNEVPDCAMPLAPFNVVRNIVELANSLFRRMAFQAQNQKRVVGFSSQEAAGRFKNAHDSDGIFWDGQKPEELSVGGIDSANLALFLQVKDLFSWVEGNLDSMGGLSPMAETARQESQIAVASSAQLADMRDAVNLFAENVYRTIWWFEWTDPVRARTLEKPVEGTNVVLPVEWSPATRKGDFLDFNFTILAQSMQDDSPTAKMTKLNAVLQQIIFPLLPMFEKMGRGLDLDRLVALVGDYSNLPELGGLIVPADPLGDAVEGSPMPAHTTRTYERVNRPGATRVGKESALIQTLMGGKAQASERDAMFRSVS